MEIEKSSVVKELVNGNRHVMADAEHSSKVLVRGRKMSHPRKNSNECPFSVKDTYYHTLRELQYPLQNLNSLPGTYRFGQVSH